MPKQSLHKLIEDLTPVIETLELNGIEIIDAGTQLDVYTGEHFARVHVTASSVPPELWEGAEELKHLQGWSEYRADMFGVRVFWLDKQERKANGERKHG